PQYQEVFRTLHLVKQRFKLLALTPMRVFFSIRIIFINMESSAISTIQHIYINFFKKIFS
ncbi:hypothetical protein AD934_00245, partial [Gluconobacter oxydans]